MPQKRVEIALEAVAALRGRVPGLHLDVVGSGWWEPTLRERVAELELGDAVTFHGHVSELEKHQLLARAWVHAMPSLKEGWGLVVVESGVHGTPTVAFRGAGGPSDSIRDGVTGILVDDVDGEPDVAAYTAALERLLVDDELRARMSAGGPPVGGALPLGGHRQPRGSGCCARSVVADGRSAGRAAVGQRAS